MNYKGLSVFRTEINVLAASKPFQMVSATGKIVILNKLESLKCPLSGVKSTKFLHFRGLYHFFVSSLTGKFCIYTSFEIFDILNIHRTANESTNVLCVPSNIALNTFFLKKVCQGGNALEILFKSCKSEEKVINLDERSSVQYPLFFALLF